MSIPESIQKNKHDVELNINFVQILLNWTKILRLNLSKK